MSRFRENAFFETLLLVSSLLLTVTAHKEEEQAVLFQDVEEEQAVLKNEEQQQQQQQDVEDATVMLQQLLLSVLFQGKGHQFTLLEDDMEAKRLRRPRRGSPVRRSLPSSQLAWQALKIPRCNEIW